MVIVKAKTLPDHSVGKLLIEGTPNLRQVAAVWLFVLVPLVALLAAIPLTIGAGWGPSWLDAGMAVSMYCIGMAGAGTGFHRFFTHGSFKARRSLKIALALAGGLAVEGPVIQWVADHRRHHQYADRDGDPHSPWRFGTNLRALSRGFWHAHAGWMLTGREFSNRQRFAPDLLRDRDIRVIDRLFPLMVVISIGLPTLIGGIATGSWAGAASAFFWAGLVRLALLHHVTWSINSICHMFGERPFAVKNKSDKAANFWPLAIFSFGESWHNLHHADPTCARHGVERGQIDINARLIWLFEKLGWAWDVRWPNPQRLNQLRQVEDHR